MRANQRFKPVNLNVYRLCFQCTTEDYLRLSACHALALCEGWLAEASSGDCLLANIFGVSAAPSCTIEVVSVEVHGIGH
jgi:hypothetical protein